jgi:hypothetical protein
MKRILLIIFAFMIMGSLFAQKKSFGVVSFLPPENWQQQQNEGGIQFSISDNKTGAYAVAVITRASVSDATANENFNTDWTRLVKSTVQVTEEPVLQDPLNQNGWNIISGNAGYSDGSNKGMVTLLTATGGGQMASVVIMTNTQIYQDELIAFLHSLELAGITANSGSNTPIANNADSSSIIGLWSRNTLETNGYMNGIPQYTSGYIRSEYLLKKDGTYIYRAKIWLVYGPKDISFVYETGTYAVNNNQITILPNQGKSGWWKKTKSTKEWGPFARVSTDYKLEKKTFNFEIKYSSGSDETELILKTENNSGMQENRYTKRKLNESLIDNPPGFKTAF